MFKISCAAPNFGVLSIILNKSLVKDEQDEKMSIVLFFLATDNRENLIFSSVKSKASCWTRIFRTAFIGWREAKKETEPPFSIRFSVYM